jgi:hypothetical protein
MFSDSGSYRGRMRYGDDDIHTSGDSYGSSSGRSYMSGSDDELSDSYYNSESGDSEGRERILM